jgi:predicted PurR-regulated permease PerM
LTELAASAARRFRFAPILTATVLTVLLLWLFGRVADVLLLLFLAVLISLYLGALADLFVRRLHVPRRWGLLLSVLLSAAGLVGLVWLLVPPVVEQTQQLLRVLPAYVTAWETGIDRSLRRVPGIASVWKPGEHNVLIALYEQTAGFFQNLVPKLFSIGHAAINVVSVMVMALYLSLYPGLYREWLIALFPPIHRDLVRDVLGDLADSLRSWIVGQLLAMVILAVLTAVGLYLLGVPYWLTFGLFTGAVAVVPFFGTLVSTLLPALFVLGGQDGSTRALAVIALGVVIHMVESNVVIPLITAKKVELPPVLTIMSVLVVGKLLGPVGLLVAVPTLVVLMVVVRRILLNRIYEGHGFRRVSRDRTLVLRVPVPDGGGVLVPESANTVDLIGLAERALVARTA